MNRKVLAAVLAVMMLFSVLPMSVFAKLDTGHSIDVRFTVLYVGDEFNIGYNTGASESTKFVCQYSTAHSDTAYNNHTIAISDIKAAADRATLNAGYEIVGWAKDANANPTINKFPYEWQIEGKTTACNKGTTIYLVAKDTTPKKYVYNLYYKWNNGTDSTWLTDTTTPTAATTFTHYVNRAKLNRSGYKFLGWADDANATSPDYIGGEPITLTKDNPSKTIYAVWKEHEHNFEYVDNGDGTHTGKCTDCDATTDVNQPHVDENEDGKCDKCGKCMHDHDENGYCTVPGCGHGDDCCEKKLPTIVTRDDLNDLAFVQIVCDNDAAHNGELTVKQLSSFTTPSVKKDGDRRYATFTVTTLECFNLYKGSYSSFGDHTLVGGQAETYECEVEFNPVTGMWEVKTPVTIHVTCIPPIRDYASLIGDITVQCETVPGHKETYRLGDLGDAINTGYGTHSNSETPNLQTVYVYADLFVNDFQSKHNDPAHTYSGPRSVTVELEYKNGEWTAVSGTPIVFNVECVDPSQPHKPTHEELVELFPGLVKVKCAAKFPPVHNTLGVSLIEGSYTIGDLFHAYSGDTYVTLTITNVQPYIDEFNQGQELTHRHISENNDLLTTSIVWNKTTNKWDKVDTYINDSTTTSLWINTICDWTPDVPALPSATLICDSTVNDHGNDNKFTLDITDCVDLTSATLVKDPSTWYWEYTVAVDPVKVVEKFNRANEKLYGTHEAVTNELIPFTLRLKNNVWGPKDNPLEIHMTCAQAVTVTYNANAGTDTVTNLPDSASVIPGMEYTLSDTIPARRGYDFLGWSLDPAAETPEYSAAALAVGVKYAVKEATTFYAVWAVKTVPEGTPDLTKVLVRVQCVNPDKDPATVGQQLGHYPIDYGVPVGSGDQTQTEDGYFYTVTVDSAYFINVYNTTPMVNGGTYGEHTLDSMIGSTITWKWVRGEWVCQTSNAADNPGYPGCEVKAVISVKCKTTPTEAPDMSTIRMAVRCVTLKPDGTPVHVTNDGYGIPLIQDPHNPPTMLEVTNPDFEPDENGDIYFIVTVNPESTIANYNKLFGGNHVLAEDSVLTVTWKWVDNAWVCQNPSISGMSFDNVKLVINVKCEPNIHIVIFKQSDLTKPVKDTKYTTTHQVGETFDLSEINVDDYYTSTYGYEVLGGWFDDGLFNIYKRDGSAPALETLTITGAHQNLKLVVADYVPVQYFLTADDLTKYQNEHDTSCLLVSTKALEGAVLPTSDAPAANRDGHTFLYWSREGQNADVTGQTVTGWTNLYGVWKVNEYRVSFNAEGGEPTPATQTVKYNEYATRPEDPKKTGYKFLGWFEHTLVITSLETDIPGSFVFETTPITHNTELYAQWELLTGLSYTVKYVEAGTNKQLAATKTVDGLTFGTSVKESPIAIKGYNPTNPAEVTLTIGETGNEIIFTYTARTDITYTVRYMQYLVNAEIAPAKVVTGQTYGTTVTESAIDILYYIPFGDTAKTLTLDTENNEIIFYYTYYNPFTPILPPQRPQLNTADHYAYVMGYPDGTVRPEESITRAEVATIFFRLLTDESRAKYWTSENSFSDVKAGEWYNNAISTLANAGIVNGYADGTFRPNAPITRGEMAKVVAQFATLDTTADIFSDISGHWSEAYINLAAGNGWINGYPDGSFKPEQSITRAETMTMINRVLNRVPADASRLLPVEQMVTFPDCAPDAWYYVNVQEATNSHTYERKKTEKNGDENWIGRRDNKDWTQLEG